MSVGERDAGSPQFRPIALKSPVIRVQKCTKPALDDRLFLLVGVCWWTVIFAPPILVFWLFNQGHVYLAFGIVALYASSYLRAYERDPHHTRRWDLFLNSWLVSALATYCDMRLISTAEVPSDRRYIFCLHPHGVWPIHGIALLSNQLGFKELFPGLSFPRVTCASVIFRLPFIREVALWCGALSADKHTIRRALEAKQNVGIIVGGSAEILECFPGHDAVYLRERKGFIRMALETGSDLIPTYAFGVTDLYRQISWPWLKRLQRWVLKRTKMVMPLIYGHFWLVPLKAPVRVVVGEPIRVPLVKNPSQAEIDNLHQDYLAALVALFDKYKADAGYPEASLRVV